MNDEARALTEKYISAVELALGELTPAESRSEAPNLKIGPVIDAANRYLTDAKYYLNAGKQATALASVSYAEGLLDALKVMGLVTFEWKRIG
jgi:FAD synthetase